MPRGDDDALDAIRQGLVSRAEDVALGLLGEPAHRTRDEWRWGRKGALAMVIRGPKRGLWSDHANGDEGGDLLDLIQRERSGGFPAALDYARALLRLPVDYTPPPRPTVTGAPKPDASDAARIAFARRLWSKAGEVRGTVAERYLTDTRRIPAPAAGWPECVRYHPGRCALIVAATTTAGEVQAVQLVHLTTEATKQPDMEKRPTKQSYGPQAGAAVRLPARQVALQVTARDASLLLAEGPETGLSIWAATGRETWIALGGVGKVQPTPGRRLVVCADDDPPDSPGAKGRRKAVSRWRTEGFAVVLAHPWARRRRDKSDFNDVLQDHGLEAVRARIDAALSDPGHGGVQAVPVKQARAVLQKAMASFIVAARDFIPDDLDSGCVAAVHAIRGGVGTGKSDAALRHIARELQVMRKRGDTRNVAVAVPRHLLAEEQAERFRDLPESAGLTAAGWRGRKALDPQAPGYLDKAIPDERKTKMCRDLPAVRDAEILGLPVEENVCRRRKGGKEFVCPFHGECGAQRQKGQRADVWFVPHESLFGPKPAALGELFAVVVDEAPWQDGLQGLDSDSITLALDAFTRDAVVPNDFMGRNTQRLRDVYRRVIETLRGQPDGPLRRDAMLAADVTAETAKDGRILTWDRHVDPGFRPGMTAAQRREAMTAAKDNPTIMRLARFFRALETLVAEDGPEASGWIALETQVTDHGPVRVLRLRGRRDVGKGWRVPTLLIDARLNPALVRP
ncbi:MAG: putative primase/helicase, partial [Spirosoma sp.]|nr:putative primase/helicase [Spirosoma sp.]